MQFAGVAPPPSERTEREETGKPLILLVIGTRPEAIKLFPVARALRQRGDLATLICTTGQHSDMVAPVLTMAGIAADLDLAVMRAGQSLDALTARLIEALGDALDRHRPALVVVQGDTVSAMAAAVAAMFRRIPVAHVEAGLRSGALHDPCPEEGNRRIISALASLHFAPTPTAEAALRAENARDVLMTGNTVMDALAWTDARLRAEPNLAAPMRRLLGEVGERRLLFTTVHRRESLPALAGIARALARIAARGDVAVLLPVHPNPRIHDLLHGTLAGRRNIILTSPLDYPSAILALSACYGVLTDSGGLQEEAPYFGKPVLVMRDTTERPEGLAAGTARLIGTAEDAIVAAAADLLDDRVRRDRMATRHLSYGAGGASRRIAAAIAAYLRQTA